MDRKKKCWKVKKIVNKSFFALEAGSVAIGKPERQVRKFHCGNKQRSCTTITLLLLVLATYIWVLFFAHISFVVNHTFNATPTNRLQQYYFANVVIDSQFLWLDYDWSKSWLDSISTRRSFSLLWLILNAMCQWGGSKILYFMLATVFCLRYRLSKHKVTRYSENMGAIAPWVPWLRSCQGPMLLPMKQVSPWLQFCRSKSYNSRWFRINFLWCQWRTQKISEGSKFRRNRVTSQINFSGSAEGTTILGDPGACPRENFAKFHLKIRIFVHSGSKF